MSRRLVAVYIMPATPLLLSWSAWASLLQSVRWSPNLQRVLALDLSVLQRPSHWSGEKPARCAGELNAVSPTIQFIQFYFSRTLKIVCPTFLSRFSVWRTISSRNVTAYIHSVVHAYKTRRLIYANGIMVRASQRWQCSPKKSPHFGLVLLSSKTLVSHLLLSPCTIPMGASKRSPTLRRSQSLPGLVLFPLHRQHRLTPLVGIGITSQLLSQWLHI